MRMRVPASALAKPRTGFVTGTHEGGWMKPIRRMGSLKPDSETHLIPEIGGG
jgi:hypothetical protein